MRDRKYLGIILSSSLLSLASISLSLELVPTLAAQAPGNRPTANPVQLLSDRDTDNDPPAAAAPDSKGTDFWLAFPGNNGGDGTLSLFITSDTSTTGTVTITALEFSQGFSVTAGTVTTVSIPTSADLGYASDAVRGVGIHVTALSEVTVYGLNRISQTTDAYLGLPTDILGTEYVNLGYGGSSGSELAIVSTIDGTVVTITPSVATGLRSAGVAYSITLNQGQVYQLQTSSGDLSGTIISSDKPVAVFGGHQCANVPPAYAACDHLVEQLFPTSTWGKSFVTVPLATRLNGDTFRFLASTDGTQVKVGGVVVATLNRGQFHERILTAASHVTSDKPILVAQYSNGTDFDYVTSDPFMMLIPPFEQFLAGYTVTTPATGFDINYVNVAAPNSTVGSITLDGTVIPAASFTAIGSSGFSGAQVILSLGSHRLAGPLPFGTFVYGFASYDSYGYPGGLSLSAVATVTSVVLAPKTGTNPVNTQHCATATVKDQNSNPVVGVRVDFAVTGANARTGFANTNSAGEAQFCYTGINGGTDTVTASVGSISDTATKIWSSTSTDLALTKADSLDPINIGSNLTYTMVVANNGPTNATAVTLIDVLPAGMSFVTATTTQGTCSGTSTVTCNLGSLAKDQRATVTILVTATQAGLIQNTATVSAAQADSNPANNRATASTTVKSAVPEVALSPTSLSFSTQSVGTSSAPRTVTLTNTGTGQLSIISVEASGDFSVTSRCGFSVPAGGSCPLDVTFRPTASGARIGTLTIIDDAPGSPHTVALTGIGSAPAVTLSRTSIIFASQRVGTTSSAQSVTLSNTGAAALNITSVTAGGDFSVTNNCGASVPAGANCVLSAAFAPTAAGTRTGVITIVSNAPGSPHTITLSGIGSAPTVILSSTSLSFGSQRVGTTSASLAVTLSNTGNATLVIAGITIGGDFALANNCSSSVAAGGSCTFSVTFHPLAAGIRTGDVTISSDAPGSPHLVALAGTGLAPVVSVSPASLSFATQRVGTTSAAQVVTLTNSGTAPLILSGIVASGDFGLVQNCGLTLAIRGSCALEVTFSPTGHGTRIGEITITSDAPGSPHRISLSGDGSFTAVLSSLSPASGPIQGGNFITLTGSNFAAPGAGATSVHFGAEPSRTVTVVNDSMITARAPAGSGNVPVTVTNNFGESNSVNYAYFQSSGPLLAGLTPSAGSPAGGSFVRIAGRNFVSGATVRFGSTPATEVLVLSDIVITCTSPPGSGVVDVSVTTPQGTGTLPAAFTYRTGQTPGTQLNWFAPEAPAGLASAPGLPEPRDLSATRVTSPVTSQGNDTAGVPQLASYNVYRSTDPVFSIDDTGKAQLVAIVPAGILAWFDPDPPGTTGQRPALFYKVTAAYDQGESAPSNIASPEIAVTGAALQLAGGRLTLIVEGVSFATFRSLIQVNGVTVQQTNYPQASRLGNGTSARIEGFGDFDALIPPGMTASVVVVNPGTRRDLSDAQFSPVFLFKR